MHSLRAFEQRRNAGNQGNQATRHHSDGRTGRNRGSPFDEEKRVVGTLVGGRQAMREVVAAARKIVPVTETHRLDEANEMLRSLKDGELSARAVLVP